MRPPVPEHAALEARDGGEIAVNAEYIDFLDCQIEEIETHMEQLRGLLAKHTATLEREGLRPEMDSMLEWMTRSAEGLRTARHLFEAGPGWLNGLHQRVALAKDELSRLEAEGGNQGPRDTSYKDLGEVWTEARDILGSMEGALAHPRKLVDAQGEPLQLLC